MLELSDLAAECTDALADAQAAEALNANAKTRLAVDVVHRDLIGVQRGRHPHRSELLVNVGRDVGLFGRAAHAAFPIRMPVGHEFFRERARLVLVKINELVFVIWCKTEPGWPEHKGGRHHQQDDANRRQCLRSKHIRTSPPGPRFLQASSRFNLGFFLEREHTAFTAVGLEAFHELRLGSAYAETLLAQHLLEFSNGFRFHVHGLTRGCLAFIVQELGGLGFPQISSPVQRRPTLCSRPNWSNMRATMKSTRSSMLFGWL